MENIELYIIIALVIILTMFILNTLKYYRGEKRKIKNLHRFAKEGEVESQSKLADHYHKGKMVKKNHNKAAFWYQKAAFKGDIEAKGHLKEFFNEHDQHIKKTKSL